MVKTTACVAGLILVFAAFALTRHANANGKADGLYHGATENTAVEQRQDSWWQEAKVEVTDDKSWRWDAPKILYRGNPELKEIALTFDDGPHPGKVQELLNVLDQLDVRATFFVVGKMVEKHPELIKMEEEHGDEIADHSFSHVDLAKIPEDEVEIEYAACKDLIKKVTGKDPLFCRPPGGQATPEVMRGAAKCDLTTAMWSDDPKDYANPGPDVILQRTLEHANPGGIILLHEGVDETMQVLPQIVNTLRSEGYRFVTMSELAEDAHRHTSEERYGSSRRA
jgi:peptidoglycan/xylan/chitin deacetylase (PgdA/CDA1 family)